MIRVIYRNFSDKKLSEKKWDFHPAFFHFMSFKGAKAVYLNGIPLKWHNIFKNGDVVEVVYTPAIISSTIAGTIGAAIIGIITGTPVAATSAAAITVGVLTVTAVTAAASVGLSFLVGKLVRGGSVSPESTTQNKTYSSNSNPELKGAQNDISDGIIPVLFGKTQQTPSYGQLPYRLVSDGSGANKFMQFFIPNYNNVVYSDFKLGETNIDNYSSSYYSIRTLSGNSQFLGHANVKAISVDEELSYNKEGEVTQSSTQYINETVAASSVGFTFTLRFENVASTSSFTSKTFTVTVNAQNGENPVTLTQDFTVTNRNITSSGSYYVFSGSASWNTSINYLTSVLFAASTNTRNNKTETNNELNVVLTNERITAGNFTRTYTPNQNVNKYQGTPSEVINTSPENTTEIDVIISFPQGLYKVNKSDGNRLKRSTTIEIMYKEENSSTWHNISDATSIYVRDISGVKQPISSSTTTVDGNKITVQSPSDLNVADQLFFRPIGFTVPAGKYSVRVRSAEFSDKTNYDVGVATCSEIQFRVQGDVVNPIILPKVNQIAFEVKAYKGLSGTLKKFNYIGEAFIPVWNGENWNTTAKSTNPAAIIRYLLTDTNANPRAISPDLINNDSLVHYYEWCEEQGYEASGVISESIKTLDVIDEILKNSQGAMIPLLNGKHTFAIDGDDKIPKGLFNQHNSWDFVWTPNVGRLTEAIRVSYIDNSDYTQTEITVYWYDGAVHETIKAGTTDDDYLLIKKDLKYINDRSSVLKSIKYELETIQTKRDNFEFKCNLEALNMTILDRIYITNTANMQNEQTGLIKSVISSGENITGFRLYSPVDIAENSQIVIRSLDYENEQPLVNIFTVTNSGMSDTVYIEPVVFNSQIRGECEITGLKDSWHYDGDLFAIGQGTIYDCVITDIRYDEDCTATITARNY